MASPFDLRVPPQRERVWDIVLVIAAGGALGGAGRHALNSLDLAPDAVFPWSTFVENATGSFLLALLMVYLLQVAGPSRYVRPFFGVGMLGGFTTFSAYTSETRALLLESQGPLALVYLSGSVAAGLAAAWTGLVLGRSIATRRTRSV